MMSGATQSEFREVTDTKARSLRCLIVVPSLIRAGAETQAVDLANGLAAIGHRVHLCSFEEQLDQKERLSEKVRFHHVPRRSKYDITVSRRLSRIIDKEHIEVVQGVLQFAVLVGWIASKFSQLKPPVIAAVHTTVNRGFKQEFQDRVVYRKLLRNVSAIVFVCEHQKAHWLRKYPELRCQSTVVYNGVEPERFSREDFVEKARSLRNSLDIPDAALMFSCIGAFRPEKGHRILFEAFSRVEGRPYLVLAGDGELRPRMESVVQEMGCADHIRFLGNIPDTRPLIAASNATVLASTAVETFSMAMLESMALGVPMIAPVIGGLSEAIIDGETGLLFPIGDVDALASSLQSVVNDAQFASAMGQAAHEAVVEQFSLDRMVAGSERVMRECLNARK